MTEQTIAAPETPVRAAPRGALRRLVRRPRFLVPAVVLVLLLLVALFPAPFAGLFGHGDPRACNIGDSVATSRPGHPFGFDVQGCDVYANVIYGTRSSIAVSVLTTFLSAVVAIVLGTLAGLRRGAVDWVISRVTDIFLGFPFLLGAIVVLTAVGNRSVITVSAVLALFGWTGMARLMRSSVRSVQSQEYVQAAVTMGLSRRRVVGRYILPNALAPLFVVATLTVGGVIVAESSLTYLGIGLQAPAISWGLQLAAASSSFQNAPHLLVWPGLFLVITVLAVIGVGDAVRVAFDPRGER